MGLIIGDHLPVFTLEDQEGRVFSPEEYLGKPLVIYFYPRDFTPGCTSEACDFRDHYHVFEEAGASVVGISSDSVERHASFAGKYHLPFRLLSDRNGKVAEMFGVKRQLFGLLPGRETFIFDPKGILIHKFSSMKAGLHLGQALKMINTL